MRCIRTPIEAEVTKYEMGKGLEDGFELFATVVTSEHLNTENLLQVNKDGMIYCPYITTRRGKTFIRENDYIIEETDGTRVVCGADKVATRYQEIK